MVSVSPADDRAQLLLIGAIAISLVVVGTVVLLNDMKFTETVGTQGNDEMLTDADRTTSMIETDLVELTSRIREETTWNEFRDALDRNVTAYNNYYANMSVERGTVYINVSVNTSCTSCQYRLLENSSEEKFAGERLNASLGTEIERIPEFNLTISDDELDDKTHKRAFQIEVRNDTGATWRIKINETKPPANEHRITTYDDSSVVEAYSSADESWFENDHNVTLDLTEGCINASDSGFVCDKFEFANGVSEPYTVSFNNTFSTPAGPDPQSFKGTFRLVANGEGPADSRVGLAIPTFDIAYERSGLVYRKTIRLDEEQS